MEAALTSSTPSHASATIPSKSRRWAGALLSALPALFLVFDGAMKLVKIQPVVEAMDKMGFPDAAARPIGLILIACVVLYAVPRTAVIGAVLLTGYLGGAIATHVRIADPLFSHTLFPVYFGILLWGGLYLRDARVRALVRPAPSSGDASAR